jgi:Flavin-binding monooxygenase-like
VASGTFGRTPYVPGFADQLDPGIVQLHSSAYKSPAQLRPGGVLVVGASHSGGDIAFEVGSAGHPTVLSGRIHGEIPLPVTGGDGWPLERRGVVPSAPGLYFVGLAFQYAFASMLVGGAGRDAEYVVKHLCARTPTLQRAPSVPRAA